MQNQLVLIHYCCLQKNNLKPEDASEVLLAEAKLSEAKNDLDKTEAYKVLSSAWYKINRFAIAGYYA